MPCSLYIHCFKLARDMWPQMLPLSTLSASLQVQPGLPSELRILSLNFVDIVARSASPMLLWLATSDWSQALTCKPQKFS